LKHPLLKQRPVAASYLAFLKRQMPLTGTLVKKLIEAGKSGDPFRAQESLNALQLALQSGSADRAASTHMVLLLKLDAFQNHAATERTLSFWKSWLLGELLGGVARPGGKLSSSGLQRYVT
jgi:hypothetical protein